MAEKTALAKILHIRENEKDHAQKTYQTSVDRFEEVAGDLYDLLRQKERAESAYKMFLRQPTPIDKVRKQASYIDYLKTKITGLQHHVQKARQDMATKHDHLSAAYVEMKKIEKVINHRHEHIAAMNKKQEDTLMDELSMQQYMRQQIGEAYGTKA